MERRTCAGKPDGTPCGAPAVRGTDYCRHHRPALPVPMIEPSAAAEELVLVLSAAELREPVPDDPEVNARYADFMSPCDARFAQTLREVYAEGGGISMVEEQMFRAELRRQGVDD